MKKLIRRIIHWFKDLKIHRKLIVFFVLTSMIPILILGIFAYMQEKANLLKQEKSNLRESNVQAIQSMDNQLTIYNNLSEYIAYSQAVSNTLSADQGDAYQQYVELTGILDPMLSSVKYINQDVKQITVYSDLTKVEHDTTLAPLSKIEKEEWYQNFANEALADNRWYLDYDNHIAFEVRSMPLLEDIGSKGVLYVKVDYDKLFEAFESIKKDSGSVAVYNEDGRLVYSNFDKDTKKEIDVSELSRDSSQWSKTIRKNYTSSEEKNAFGWRVVLLRSNSAINSSINSIIYLIIIVMAGCILMGSVILFIISRFMVRDIQKLSDNMKEVEAGNLEIHVSSDSNDEVGQMVRGFGTMITEINQLIDEVYKGKISQKEYEMKALQAQINPHFLYNSLSLINWKAIEADQQDISRITLLLSKFYRTALNKGKNILSIKDEISNVQSYIDLQRMMHDDSFDVTYDLDESIMEYAVPNLILQPLIENAIDHGVDLKTDGKGVIHVESKQEGEDILLTISDNGVGMPQEQAEQILTEESKGYGVKNVQERIRLFYGQEYGLTITSKEGKGTAITIRIPKKSL